MSEDANLQARIAALAGRINQQRHNGPTPTHSPPYQPPPPPRWSPYGHAPRRAFHSRPLVVPTHRNRTLVVSNGTNSPSQPRSTDVSDNETGVEAPKTAGWVSTRDRGHMQLINTAVYDQKAQEKQQAMEATARAKQQARNEKEKNKVMNRVGTQPSTSAAYPQGTASREVIVNDLRFRVAADGSKLIRIFGESCRSRRPCDHGQHLKHLDGPKALAQSTPKQTRVAGVTFHRSKHGNLLRAGLVKKQRYHKRSLPSGEEERRLITCQYRTNANKKSTRLCAHFTSTGTHPPIKTKQDRHRRISSLTACPGRPFGCMLTSSPGSCLLGNRCRDVHDINKLAICKDFLRSGQCVAGEDACNLSHDPTPNRVPACTHFLRGNCTNADCRYAHVHVSPSAPVCHAFATLGYCEKGATCAERHVIECPDYANTGNCRKSNCRLPHVDRAGNLRKAAALKASKGSGDDNSSDLSSDDEGLEEIGSDDVDSEDLDEDVLMAGSGEQSHDLVQQEDFIAFS